MTSWSGTLIADTEPGVDTVTGSFLTKVAVNMKKVSNRTMTSDIGVMSMNVSLFLIAKRPIYIVFTFLNVPYFCVSWNVDTIVKPTSSSAYVRWSILFV